MAVKHKIPSMIYLAPDAHRRLAKLAERTRIPRAVLVREAIDDLLNKYNKRPKGGAQ